MDLSVSLLVLAMNQQYSLPAIRGQENNPCCFKRPAHLIPRCLIHLEPVLGLEALQGSQRYSGLVSERLLRPTQQRACGPRLSSGDNA